MKVAKRKIPVYSPDGKLVIGDLDCGQKTFVLGELDEGVVVAYVLGLIKPGHRDMLVSESEFEKEVSEKDRFVVWAGLQSGQQTSGFVVRYLQDRRLISSDISVSGLYFYHCKPIDKSDVVAGDLVFRFVKASGTDKLGVYMGDGTVVYAQERGANIVREDIDALGWRRFARVKAFGHSDMNKAVYVRRLKKLRNPMRGDDVRTLQFALGQSGQKVCIDGVFGKKTQKALKAYQKEIGHEADGIADEKTFAGLTGGE